MAEWTRTGREMPGTVEIDIVRTEITNGKTAFWSMPKIIRIDDAVYDLRKGFSNEVNAKSSWGEVQSKAAASDDF
jgi:hypothetical protein